MVSTENGITPSIPGRIFLFVEQNLTSFMVCVSRIFANLEGYESRYVCILPCSAYVVRVLSSTMM